MKLFTLPNILTLANLFCGCLSCIFIIKGTSPDLILVLLFLSLLFDFFDGFAARLTKQSSEIGGQLDSLADMISFGLVPGLLMINMLGGNTLSNSLVDHYVFEKTGSLPNGVTWGHDFDVLIPFISLFIPLFSALRLAKFNLDTEQTYYFKGLNTPTNTILIFSLYYLFNENKISLLGNPFFLLVLIAICCWLLISNIPMMSLKFKGFNWKGNELIFSFLGISLILILLFKMLAVPFVVLMYILLSIIFKKQIVK